MSAPASPLLERHAAAGAVLAGADGLPACYGRDETTAIATEYAAARESAVVVELAERTALEVSGPLRQKFLHNILSNDIAGVAAGQGVRAALMDVKGHLIALMRALVLRDAVRLELPAERLERVHAALDHYKVGAPVRFSARPLVVLGLLGPRVRPVFSEAGAPLPELAPEGHASVSLATRAALLARAGDLPGEGFVLHVAAEDALAVWDRLLEAGVRPLGRRALDALRIEAGRPWYGPDIGEPNLLHETGLLREYHSATKGCYIGQEVIARLEARGGHVNKALRGLRLSAPARPGAVVSAAGEEVGHLTTAAVSPRSGPIAMAYLHRKHYAPGTELEVEGRAARVALLPLEP